MSSPSIRVRLLAFGPLGSLVPRGGVWREVVSGDSVADLLEALCSEGLVDRAVLRCAAIAVNQQYSQPSVQLKDGDEVAILPPVSGGFDEASAGSGSRSEIALVRGPIDGAAIVRAIKADADGAVCVFDGIVRDNSRGRRTLYLEYEAYEEMALRQLHLLRARALQNFGVREAVIVHRLGRIEVGETSVLIAVASAHRAAAFEACRWIIDTLKKTVPIWKLEQFADGSAWADGEPFPEDLASGAL
ncbi:MAG: molybdenum cofactor biosynthesis protein [Acidobacteriaceae bacterium]